MQASLPPVPPFPVSGPEKVLFKVEFLKEPEVERGEWLAQVTELDVRGAGI